MHGVCNVRGKCRHILADWLWKVTGNWSAQKQKDNCSSQGLKVSVRKQAHHCDWLTPSYAFSLLPTSPPTHRQRYWCGPLMFSYQVQSSIWQQGRYRLSKGTCALQSCGWAESFLWMKAAEVKACTAFLSCPRIVLILSDSLLTCHHEWQREYTVISAPEVGVTVDITIKVQLMSSWEVWKNPKRLCRFNSLLSSQHLPFNTSLH